MKNEAAAAAIAIAAGIIVWVLVAALGGRREAWDSGLYWLSLPLLYAISGALGYYVPRKAWRWGMLPFAGQFAWMLVTQPLGALAVLGLVYMAVLSVPGVGAAMLCAKHRQLNMKTTENTP
jgi:hypothetical protein